MMKMLSGNTLSGVCVYMYVTFLVGEIVDRFLGELYAGDILLLTKNRAKAYFFLSSFEGNVDLLQS